MLHVCLERLTKTKGYLIINNSSAGTLPADRFLRWRTICTGIILMKWTASDVIFHSIFLFFNPYLLSRDLVAIDGFWRIYLTQRVITHYSILLLTHTHTHARTHARTSVQTRLHCHCLVTASNSRHSPSSWFPNWPRPQLPASHSNSSQWLNSSGYLTNWLTNWLIATANWSFL
jgi:hypothetical protein